MTVYDINKICDKPIVIYTMCGEKYISIFTQHGPDGDMPELFDDCIIHEIWCEDGMIAVRI